MYIVLNSCFFIFAVIQLNLPLERLIPSARISRQIFGILRMFSKWREKACKHDKNSFYLHVYVYLYFYKEYIFQFSVDNTIRKKGTLFWKKVKVSPFCNVLTRKINNYRSMNQCIYMKIPITLHAYTFFFSQQRCCTAS